MRQDFQRMGTNQQVKDLKQKQNLHQNEIILSQEELERNTLKKIVGCKGQKMNNWLHNSLVCLTNSPKNVSTLAPVILGEIPSCL